MAMQKAKVWLFGSSGTNRIKQPQESFAAGGWSGFPLLISLTVKPARSTANGQRLWQLRCLDRAPISRPMSNGEGGLKNSALPAQIHARSLASTVADWDMKGLVGSMKSQPVVPAFSVGGRDTEIARSADIAECRHRAWQPHSKRAVWSVQKHRSPSLLVIRRAGCGIRSRAFFVFVNLAMNLASLHTHRSPIPIAVFAALGT